MPVIGNLKGPSGVSSFATGGDIGSTTISPTTGTVAVVLDAAVKTITPTGNCTFNVTGGVIGQVSTFSILTSGTTSFTLTFNTNVKATGTLSTGILSGKRFSVTFRCIDGTIWQEISRTTAM